MYRLQWYVILLLLSLTNATECPEGRGCTSCEMYNDEYRIECLRDAESDSYFEMKIEPQKLVTIICHNSPNWTEFHSSMNKSTVNLSSIAFDNCDLPELEELSAIARQIVANPVEILEWELNKNSSLPLTRSALSEFQGLKELRLYNTGLTNVTSDLLYDLKNLTLLDLSENHLHELPRDFLNLPSLESIELMGNRLRVIKPSMFDKSTNLRLLNIWKNQLVEIEANSFDKLEALRNLDIHMNKLTFLPDKILDKLSNLRVISLSQNNFTEDSLREDLFRNNSLLKTVRFFENQQKLITLPSKFFGNLKNLSEVFISKNGLVRLPEDLFVGDSGLEKLYMESNRIEVIPRSLFKDCTNLMILNLSFNELRNLPEEVFSTLKKLVDLDLKYNHITSISENVFKGLQSLKTLNLENNGLKTIHPNALDPLQSLTIVNFSNNQLTLKSNTTAFDNDFGPKSPFHDCMNTIEHLSLSHNNITDIFGDWILALNLKTLDLDHNSVRLLQVDDFQFLSNDIKVNLSSNKIEKVILQTVEILFKVQPPNPNNKNRTPPQITITNNPISCDCDLYDLLRYYENRMDSIVYTQFTLLMDNLTCQEPNTLKKFEIKYLKSPSFKCLLDEPEYYNASCPKSCDCRVRPENFAYIIDCSNQNLQNAPGVLQSPLGLHIELNLTGNSLTSMPSMTQPGYDSITILSLSKNKITEFPRTGVSKKLEVLYLDYNNLKRLDHGVMDFLINSTNLKNLTLHENPWIADCEAREFLSFIQTKMVKIPELQRVAFAGGNSLVFEMTPEELCPAVVGWVIGLSIGIAALGVIAGGLAALYYRYQHEIKVWLYARRWCLWFVSEDELDKDKLYDAFVSYSHKDQEFVEETLVPTLENGPTKFKICYHERDWMGGQIIPEQIARSVDDSRRTVVVLSPDFLESAWGKMEFRQAHMQALSEGRARVIVIIYRDIGPIDKLEPELKAYLSMNTYIKWGDRWFWDKLNYALPHPEEVMKKKKKPTIFASHQPVIRIGDDKRGGSEGNCNNGSLVIKVEG